MKKLLMFVVGVLFTSCLSFGAGCFLFSREGEPDDQDGYGDENAIFEPTAGGWRLTGFYDPAMCTGDYVIQSEYWGSPVVEIDGGAFEGTSFTSLTVPESIERVVGDSFSGCKNLTSVVWNAVRAELNGFYMEYPFFEDVTESPEEFSNVVTGLFADSPHLSEVTFGNRVQIIPFAAFGGCAALTDIDIPDSVTAIGGSAFWGTGLTSVALPDGIAEIGEGAFARCVSLTAISLPDGLTEIQSCTFYGCVSLTSVSLPDSVTSIGVSAFRNCRSLAEIALPRGVDLIDGEVFAGCASLSEITIPAGVTRIEYGAFRDCVSLAEVTLPEGVTYLGQAAFMDCVGLKSVTILGETELGYETFYGCTALEYAAVPASWVYALPKESLQRVVITCGEAVRESALADCVSLMSITIPESVTSIGSYAFDGCTSLTSISIPDGVTSIGSFAFRNCTGLTEINYNAVECEVDGMFRVFGSGSFETEKCEVIIGADVRKIPDYLFHNFNSATRVTFEENSVCESIGRNAFFGCSLTEFSLPESVKTIGEYAFGGCNVLAAVALGGVTSIGEGAFSSCGLLKSVAVGKDVASVGANAFTWCYRLETVRYGGTMEEWMYVQKNSCFQLDIQSSLTVVCTDGTLAADVAALSVSLGLAYTPVDDPSAYYYDGPHYMLSGKGTVTEADILVPATYNGLPVAGVAASAFKNQTTLRSIRFLGDIFSVKGSAFEGCTGLVTAVLPDSVQEILTYAFNNCSSLAAFVLPSGLESIAMFSFRACADLTEIVIPEKVNYIGTCAFQNCSGLVSVYIPGSVSEIGEQAFHNCSKLETLRFGGTSAQWNAVLKGTDWDWNIGNYTLTCLADAQTTVLTSSAQICALPGKSYAV